MALLMVLSWKLWLPGFSEFPRVPVWSLLDGGFAVGIQYTATLFLAIGIAGICIGKNLQRCVLAVAAALAVQFVCNQHCLQPWAWQAFIIAVLLGLLPLKLSKVWIARVLVSIYLFSAIGKFDYQFTHTLGLEFLETVLGWFGQTDSISNQLKVKLVLLLPLIELLIAIGLLPLRTRKVAAGMAIALHIILIIILSPVGLNHRWPVVVWNAMSILLVIWIFIMPAEEKQSANHSPNLLSTIGVAFAIVVLAGPLLRPMQLWDHWLAWGLYSPSNSRVEVLVSETATKRLGDGLQNYFQASEEHFGSQRFAIDRWSLDELGVPIYPQARFQKAAATKWLEHRSLLGDSKIIEWGPSHPLTGKRNIVQ